MTPSKKLQLVWLRRDLRSRDNKALYYASLQGPVICLWLSFEKQWQKHNDSPNKIWFWHKNLEALEKNLETLNISLVTENLQDFNQAPKLITKLAQDLNCEAVWFNNVHEANEQQRDRNVAKACNDAGLACHQFDDDTLLPPGSVLNKQGLPYKVFTPFRKALYSQISPEQWQPLPPPVKQAPLTNIPECNPLPQLRPTAKHIDKNWPAGEKSAHKTLKKFIQEKSATYKKNRDYPALTGTSSISPWLTAGVLSIRQCFSAAVAENNGELDTGNEGLCCWVSELAWREFYRHILMQFPRVSRHRAFQAETEFIAWNKNAEHLEKWQKGQTGVPIVDAAMKQLVETGWMHNRLRMVVAMYLSKDLMLDWRLGEKFFMEHLIDGDLASNNGGWQWAASTGTDAAPYFRIFNPVSQSQKFDPQGTFLRKWLPELASVDDKTIHDPAANGSLFYDESAYPKPLVDHKQARAATIEAFKALKNG
ncbi:deoxyribodipyrimidine photo-lyase [Parendozoicomonas sp. Alg238-R29]|uniref:deoxyribodipyrimidine photo-lyase n=1 Tax=Parendozoicomonas sp. Alg238-R29 TaxID=2993446 RepID=UPI00248DC312|nr:deoxyribodipyrimidine photo-lyase [Parendozoicomonas sp. Alg238-R29]